MMTMRSVALLSCAALLGACAKKADNAAATDTAAMNAAAPAAETPATAAIPAGTWNGRTMPMDRDTVIARWKMVTTADTTGWMFTPSTGKAIPARVVSRQGDSTTVEFGPYASMVRKGQTVNTRTTWRMQGDSLVGTVDSRYNSKPDSVVRYRAVATRAP